MQSEEKKNLEREIIEIAEQIIESTIKTCEDNNLQEKDKEEQVELVTYLARKLAIYIDGDSTYIPEILHQIIEQKLPDQRILADLSNFSNNLQEILNEGIAKFQLLTKESEESVDTALVSEKNLDVAEETEEIKETGEIVNKTVANETEGRKMNTERKQTDDVFLDEIEEYLRKIFPNHVLVKKYKLHGTILDYYFPDLKIALEKKEAVVKRKSNVWKEYHCKKAGIKLYKIGEEDLSSFRNFNKLVKKLVSNQ